MTNRKDSMRQTPMARSNHSSQPATYLASTVLPRLASGLDTRRSFSSLRQRQLRREELATTRSKRMASNKAHSMVRCQHCLPAHCNMDRTSRHRALNGNSSRRNTNRMEAVLCTVWVSRKLSSKYSQRNPHTSKSRSTGTGQALHPRHWPPNSVYHKPLNTTLQVKQARLARQHPRWQPSIYLRNISKLPIRNLDPQLLTNNTLVP